MQPLSARRIKDGVYQYTFDGGLVFNIIRIVDGDRYSDGRKWYFINDDASQNEGGNDWFASKSAALSALCEYVPCRVYDERYGWCMGGDDSGNYVATAE